MAKLVLLTVVTLLAYGTSNAAAGRSLDQPNGRTLQDNSSVCENGMPGVSSGAFCCPAGCGTCGGNGCRSRSDGLGADDCCTSRIESAGESCDDRGEAPCVMTREVLEPGSSDSDRYEYQGCNLYEEDDARFFPINAMQSDLAAEWCYNLCSVNEEDDYSYFAIRDERICMCGNSEDFLANANERRSGVCNIECTVGSGENCGGEESYALYFMDSSEATCRNGFRGIESTDGNHCCPLGCGECGEIRCDGGDGSCCRDTYEDDCDDQQQTFEGCIL